VATVDLSDLTPEQVVELVSSLNARGILHAITGSTLRIGDDDYGNALELLEAIGQPISDDVATQEDIGSDELRYDVSELHPRELAFLRWRLYNLMIPVTIEDELLVVDRAYEQAVDEALEASAQDFKDLVATQEVAREVKSGVRAPSCEICGRSPAAPLDLRRQVGMVIVMRTYSAQMTLCESCADTAYRQFQKSTVIKGWTGVRSALMNPVIIGTNAVNTGRHRQKIEDSNQSP
jgi:hypothetical protein